jgi:histidine triad (HIT) family protein
MNNRKKIIITVCVSVVCGVLIGGYLFSGVQPRSFLSLNQCENNCFSYQDLTGLLTSVGIQKFPSLIPSLVFETEKSIAVKHPVPESPIHYVIFPKKDIKNVGELSKEDEEYLSDAFAVIAKLIEKENLTHYQIISNGPGYQFTHYLHFHLKAEK